VAVQCQELRIRSQSVYEFFCRKIIILQLIWDGGYQSQGTKRIKWMDIGVPPKKLDKLQEC
jgi:hypothetical protein